MKPNFLVVPTLKQTFHTPLGWVITLTEELNRMRRYKVTKGWKNKILMIIHWESVKHSGSQILHHKKYLYLHHQIMMVNPRTYTHTPTVVKYGRGGCWNPSLEFFIYCSISKKITLSGKPSNFEILEKMKYILWVVALLETCAVTKHGSHLGRHLGFYEVKTEIIGNLWLTCKITHK